MDNRYIPRNDAGALRRLAMWRVSDVISVYGVGEGNGAHPWSSTSPHCRLL